MNQSPRIIGIELEGVNVQKQQLICKQMKPVILRYSLSMFIRPDDMPADELVNELKKLEGQSMNIVVAPDCVKDDTDQRSYQDDGKIESYWWVVTGITKDEPTRFTHAPAAEVNKVVGAATGEKDFHPGTVWHAHGHAHDLIHSGKWAIPPGWDYAAWVCHCRDWVIRNISETPVQPPHFCYQHNVMFEQSKKGGWGHQVDNTWCVEGKGIVEATGSIKPPLGKKLDDAGDALYLDPENEPDFAESYGGGV